MGWNVTKVIKVILAVLIAATVMSSVTMWLWNWLMPTLFGLHTVTFLQALGLLLLGKLLFGGIHRHGPRPGWKRGLEEKWAAMSPEERERFKAGMRGGRCGFGKREPLAEAVSGADKPQEGVQA